MDLVSRAPMKRHCGPLRWLQAAALLALTGCGSPGHAPTHGARPSSGSASESVPIHGLEDALADAPRAALDVALASEPFHRLRKLRLAQDPSGNALVSQLITDDLGFDEAIPSWNVTGPRPFAVDIKVRGTSLGDNVDNDGGGQHRLGEWSPWLRIGDWNLLSRTGEEVTQYAGGKVAVDVFRAAAPMYEAQIAFRSMDEGGPLDPADIEAYVTLTDRSKLHARVASAAEEPWPSPCFIEVSPRSQREDGGEIGGRICSPTSVAMVANFHGSNVPTVQMAATILDPHYEIYGNWNRAVQGAFSHGIDGRIARFSSWETVREVLAAGHPIVASIRAREGEISGAPYSKTDGHLLVITGLDSHGTVLVNDPAAKTAETVRRRYLRSDMERVWFDKGGVGYVFAGPSGPIARLAKGAESP